MTATYFTLHYNLKTTVLLKLLLISWLCTNGENGKHNLLDEAQLLAFTGPAIALGLLRA